MVAAVLAVVVVVVVTVIFLVCPALTCSYATLFLLSACPFQFESSASGHVSEILKPQFRASGLAFPY